MDTYFTYTVNQRVGQTDNVLFSGELAGDFFPLTFVVVDTDPLVEYVVKGYFYSNTGELLKAWVVTVGKPVSIRSNPWAALLAPFANSVETLPGSAVMPTGFDVAQIPAMLFLALVLAIFSWKNHATGCLICWVAALVLVGLGWFVVSLPAFGFALVLSIFIAFVEGKQTEREL